LSQFELKVTVSHGWEYLSSIRSSPVSHGQFSSSAEVPSVLFVKWQNGHLLLKSVWESMMSECLTTLP